MPRYRLTIAYDGTDFCGWQKQFPHEDSVPTAPRLPEEREWEEAHDADGGAPKAGNDPDSEFEISNLKLELAPPRPRVELRTVQGVVERAVRHVVREPAVVLGASRTDAGVHARGQVAAFTASEGEDGGGRGWPAERGTDALMMAVNARLPSDVLITAAEVVPADFDPIAGAVSKAYTYTLWCGPRRPMPFEHRYMLHIWKELDIAKMAEAARVFVGEHDFAAFAAAGHGRATTVRTVHSCDVRNLSDPQSEIPDPKSDTPCRRIQITISGSGFLWNMVRIIAGTLVEIGRGKLMEGDIRTALTTGDRRRAGPTLPPHGLCLEWIKYR